MRRLLFISPHFPPDASAGAHRARLLAPHLPAAGWRPTVLTVAEAGYEGGLDRALAARLPPDLEVVRAAAWPAQVTRRLGVGDLGLRSFAPLLATARRLLDERRYHALLITLYPTYTALLGPLLVRRRALPLVLDYQDPWVGAWGDTVGPGAGGRPDAKARLTRALALGLEPRALAATTAVTAVSRGTWDAIARRYRLERPFLELPIGFDAADLEALDGREAGPPLDSEGEVVRVVAVGTVLPLAMAPLRALLAALAGLQRERPSLAARLRLHFLGTSNQRDPAAPARVLPLARELGVEHLVREVAPRLDYFDALAAQRGADALLLVGSSEPHYTASRLYPALLARRPLLALYHRRSGVSELLARAARPPTVRLLSFDEERPLAAQEPALREALAALAGRPAYRAEDLDQEAINELSAPALARRLGTFLDGLCDARGATAGAAP